MPKKDLDLSFLNSELEEIELPSKGILYDKNNNFNKGKAHIRPWLTSEEKLIDKFNKGNFYNIIKRLVQNSLEEKTDVEELTFGDFFFILYWIRAISYGSQYKADVECPNCSAKIKSDIDIYRYSIKYLEDIKEPLSFILPKSGIELKYRLPRVKDLIEATEKSHSDSLKLGVTISPDIFRLARCVIEMVLPDTEHTILTQEEDFGTMINKIWPRLPAIDLVSFRTELAKYDHGYVNNEMTKCPECETYFEIAPLLSFEFFRPGSGEPSVNS